jgi:hypothetical protein
MRDKSGRLLNKLQQRGTAAEWVVSPRTGQANQPCPAVPRKQSTRTIYIPNPEHCADSLNSLNLAPWSHQPTIIDFK